MEDSLYDLVLKLSPAAVEKMGHFTENANIGAARGAKRRNCAFYLPPSPCIDVML